MAGPATVWAFEGDWAMSRRIEDRAGQGSGRLEGRAVFRRSGDTLICDESGTLELDGTGGSFHAARRYLWRPSEGGVAISFADGRPFHAFPLGVDGPEATHLCAPDRYEVAYDFSLWPVWQSVWSVAGARKDYVMTTRFARAA